MQEISLLNLDSFRSQDTASFLFSLKSLSSLLSSTATSFSFYSTSFFNHAFTIEFALLQTDGRQSDEVAADVSCDDSFSDTEDGAGAEQEEQPLSLAQSDWLPPVPVSKNEFIATPTYVDDDCFIYLHNMEKSKLRVVYNRFPLVISSF
jgi:hypothetical protein